ncbi:hypothetical protein [Lysobacter gummosus]|uniref:hypothetical protein n=1 Tax=Lysobacter gummosus TaxID=262324 RepID=UPI00363B57A3
MRRWPDYGQPRGAASAIGPGAFAPPVGCAPARLVNNFRPRANTADGDGRRVILAGVG